MVLRSRLLITNDPNDLSGRVTITGYPNAANSLTGTEGVLHETTGTLTSYTEQNVDGDIGGYFTITGSEVVSGMSGGGNYLDFDADGDGVAETYLIGTSSRSYEGLPPLIPSSSEATAFSPHYAELAAAIEGLDPADARTADDFARMTLISAQSLGSTLTTVQGQFFHENIYGGISADTLLGAGGDDSLFGGEGGDLIDGGSGADTLSGDDGADWFAGSSFADEATVTITDFDADGGDVIDLNTYFETLDDVVDATTELQDGSILINLASGSGLGSVSVLNTTINDLTALGVNVLCFTPDTQIHCPDGEKDIRDLKPGDLVVPHGGRTARLAAIHSRKLGRQEITSRPNLWPVLISAGALGEGVPDRDIRVSPQHRILVDSVIATSMTGSMALVPAKALLEISTVSQPEPDRAVTYIHLIFDRHEIVRANGCWSESFYPGEGL